VGGGGGGGGAYVRLVPEVSHGNQHVKTVCDCEWATENGWRFGTFCL
jgi:hypothetical protein